MHMIMNRIDVPAEDAKAFEVTFLESMRATLAGVPGLRRSALLRPTQEGQPYVSTMEFASRADFVAWLRSDSFKAAHSDREAPGMDTSSAIEQYEEIGTIEI
ncbi:antibiotic biosynthesis monooxygenase family protein [Nonomuraea sp. NPDC048826]|uniref:antibiotic biosynthesis monooxygenase family protein n=1 Tax=Nonomuraea sp. NPDC048826 TaxID=3364347 RepID=UPI0037140B7E